MFEELELQLTAIVLGILGTIGTSLFFILGG